MSDVLTRAKARAEREAAEWRAMERKARDAGAAPAADNAASAASEMEAIAACIDENAALKEAVRVLAEYVVARDVYERHDADDLEEGVGRLDDLVAADEAAKSNPIARAALEKAGEKP